VTGLGLDEAISLLEIRPAAVLTRVDSKRAHAAADRLREVGATVVIEHG
jgi:ribosomal protein L7/L12